MIEKSTFYVTTTIPYVNARPHVGFALEAVFTDALARCHRAFGNDVRFLTGTDDNALKNARAAEEEGIPTREFVDRNASQFEALRETLNLSFDDFIRTSIDQRHIRGVEKLWKACAASGDIYRKYYSGLYCVGCEVFYAEDELADGLCPDHLVRPELVEEENYFFRLSRYQPQLLELIESDTLRILPPTRKNEVLSFIRSGLRDFSISRSRQRARGWGISVPDDSSQVLYVWYDALGNYITALDYADEDWLFQKYWLNGDRVHVIGKDVIRFHAVYWPAMLLSAHVPPPKTIFIHGFLTISGRKISKSLGNVIDPVALVSEYGTDPLRFYLLRRFRAAQDGDFTLEGLIRTSNADLADQLGNLLSRVEGLIDQNYEGKVPAPGTPSEREAALIEKARNVPKRIRRAVDAFELHEALGAVWELIGEANRYVVDVAPWALAKRRTEPEVEDRLATCLYTLVEVLRLVSGWCAPFIPETAARIARRLAIELDASALAADQAEWGRYPPWTKLSGGPPLFRKFEVPAVT